MTKTKLCSRRARVKRKTKSATPKVTLSAVKALLKKWRPILGIDARWAVDVKLYLTAVGWTEEEDVAACVLVEPGYFQAQMKINGPKIEEDGGDLEGVLVHELVHIILRPLSTIVESAMGEKQNTHYHEVNEAATETLARALIAANQ